MLKTGGITAAQSGALYYLREHDGCVLTELSQALGLDKSAITGLVDRLEKKGLMERRASTSDRRAIGIFITDSGKATAEKCLMVTGEFNEMIIEGLSEKEIDTFSRILQKVISRFSR
jgi:DNA-binding MarR family transcriptional regulator